MPKQPEDIRASETNDIVLSRLPAGLADALHLSRYRRVRIPRGRSMIASGQDVDTLYLISEGWAVARLLINTGDTQILDILGPGSLAGLSRIEDVPNAGYSAIALQDVMAYPLPVNALRKACADQTEFAEWLSDMQSREARRAQRHITALGRLPARGRLAFAMLRIMDIAQQNGEKAVDTQIRLPMTQEEIGNMLGLTNVSISKLMSAFRKEGLIDYGRNRILVHDIAALSEISGMQLEANAGPASTPSMSSGTLAFRST